MQTVKIVVVAPDPGAVATFQDAVAEVQTAGAVDEMLMLADDNPLFRHLADSLRMFEQEAA